ncbi:MAG TPA: Ig-like domain-containing protein [Candidatus Acidoferrum sp.]|nr:Ig-like domain-containing protein [Candidatus Acidoferrum sp.]
MKTFLFRCSGVMFLACLLGLSSSVLAQSSSVTLVATGSVWKYLDNGTDQGIAWQSSHFEDLSWAFGLAPLGYGDGDEATVVSFGGGAKYITTYFRRAFLVPSASSFSNLVLRVLRDDGAVVYLNGAEIFRSNMPQGPITFQTLALTSVGGADESTAFYSASVDPTLLVNGRNVLAVEIHQNSVASADISFDLELVGNGPPQLDQTTVTAEAIDPQARESGPLAFYDGGQIAIRRTGNLSASLPVVLRLSGTASNGVDYSFITHEVVIPAGTAQTLVNVSPHSDNSVEGTETVVLTIQPIGCIAVFPPPPGCYVVGTPGHATVFIEDWPTATNRAPTASLVSPSAGATFTAPADITLVANAHDAEGDNSVQTVEFFAGATSLGIRTNLPVMNPLGPFVLSWQNVSAGAYTLRAVATDDHGEKGTSAPVQISVTGETTNSDRELHVIGIYSGVVADGGSSHNHEQGQASVTVNRPGQRVTLFLSSYEPVLWHITVGNATVLDRIILGGYYAQTVDGVGPETEIIPAYAPGNAPVLFIGTTIDCETFHRTVLTLHAMTGLEIASFQSASTAPYPAPFVIDSVQNDPRLLSNFPQPTSAAELPNLNFQLSFFDLGQSNLFSRHYTLAGPQDGNALLPATRVVPDASGQYFYGQYWDHIFRVDSQTGAVQPLPIGPGLPELSWSSGITYDSQLDRVLLSSFGGEGFLYAYSPTQSQWSVVSSLNNHDIAGLHYHPADDSLYGVSLNFGECSASSIQRFNSTGGFMGQIPLPVMQDRIGPNSLRAEMISVGEYLVLLLEPSVFGGSYPQESRIYLIDPRSNEVWLTYRRVYRQENKLPTVQIIWPGQGTTLAAGGTNQLAAQASDSDGLVTSVEFFANGASLGFGHRSNETASDVFAFNWTGAQVGTYTLTARATDGEGAVAISSPIHVVGATNPPPDPGGPRELHAIGLHSGGANSAAASVVVDRPGKSVTLFLSAYDSVLWHVSASGGTTIEKVILGGYYAQRVDGIASNVPVVQVSHYRTGGNPYGGSADSFYTGPTIDSAMFLQAVQKLCALTGLNLSSFHGANSAPSQTPFVINQVQNDVRLRCDYPQLADPSQLPSVNFRLAFYDRDHDGNVFFQNYTLAGPQDGTKLLPALRVVTDAGGRFYYGAEAHAMWRIDSQDGTHDEMILDSSLPEMSWPTGVAFDSQRNRILLATLSGEGHLYAYLPAQEQWSLVQSLENRDVNGLGYHASGDAIYAVKHTYESYNGSPALYCFDAQGVFQGEIPLPVLPFSLGPSDYESELVSVGDYLVLLVEPNYLSYHRGGATESRMYLIDPRSGQTTLTYRRINSADSDRDGVADDRDLCPSTPYGVAVNEQGCSIAQLCPCAGPWQNHQRYVDCVSTNAEQFLDEGLITEEQSEDITNTAEDSDCGRRPPRLTVASQTADEIRTNGCLLRLEGDGPVTCIVEYSTDMFKWTPIRTNLLSGVTIEIRDCETTTAPRRFYRVRPE